MRRLLDEVKRSQLHRLDGPLHRPVCREEDDGHFVPSPAQLAERLVAVDSGHLQVEHDQIDAAALDDFESTLTVLRRSIPTP